MLYDTSIVSSKKMWAAPVQDLGLAQPELHGLELNGLVMWGVFEL